MRILDRSTGQERFYRAGWEVPNVPASPTGGSTVDAEARTAIDGLIAALRQVWEDVQSGRGGVTVEAPLVLENINPALMEAGKMRLVNELVEEMRAGRVYPFTVAR